MPYLIIIGFMLIVGIAVFGAVSFVSWILSKIFDRKKKVVFEK